MESEAGKRLRCCLLGFEEERRSGLERHWKSLIKNVALVGWTFAGLEWWPRPCLNSDLNRANPHQAIPHWGLGIHPQPWRGPIRRNGFDGIEMTLESTGAKVFVSHTFSSVFTPHPPPTNQQKRYLHCVVPFLKDSPGKSFQEKHLIYFGTRMEGKNVGRTKQSTVNINNKRPLYGSVCLDVWDELLWT